MRNWQREQVLRQWRGKEEKEDRNFDGGLPKRAVEREEWSKGATDRKISKLLKENVKREM